jgi:hypothetical protein
MDADAMRDLVADVKKHGLQEPIVLFGGLVLDGVHRQDACALAEIEPRYVHFEKMNGSTQEAGPLAFVMSHNLRRRHLTPSQKAAVAADSLPFFEAEAAKRKTATQFKQGGRSAPKGAHRVSEGKSAAQAAKVTGASERMVERAKRLKKTSPAKFEQAKAGKLTLSKAERDRAKIDAEKQRRGAAIERIRKVCGKELADAVRNKARLKNPKEVLAFVAQSDAEMESQAGLIAIGWTLKEARNYKSKTLTMKSTLADLAAKAASAGTKLSIDIENWRFTVARTRSAA